MPEPQQAGADAFTAVTAADRNEPTERFLHADRQRVGPYPARQHDARVDLPTVGRAADLLQTGRELVVRVRRAPAARGPDDELSVSPRHLQLDLTRLERRCVDGLGVELEILELVVVLVIVIDLRKLGSKDCGGRPQARQLAPEVVDHELAFVLGERSRRCEPILDVGHQPVEHEQRRPLVGVEAREIVVRAPAVSYRPDRRFELCCCQSPDFIVVVVRAGPIPRPSRHQVGSCTNGYSPHANGSGATQRRVNSDANQRSLVAPDDDSLLQRISPSRVTPQSQR